MKLLKEVIKDLKPDEAGIKKEVNIFLTRLNSGLKKGRVDAKAIAGGSIAKGTFLKGDHDCDIFVQFNFKRYQSKDISRILGPVLKATFKKVEKLHGSRDYFQMKNSLRYEIIPVLDIKNPDKALNITDCSPLHASWVKKYQKMKDEIRLAKAFMKSAGVYGAESFVKGFSGHVVDILTIHYKGFLNLLKASKKWKYQEVIDHDNFHKGKAMRDLNRSKIQSALIVIDPIQHYRNAAAVLSKEKFDIFRKAASDFLKKPSKDYFIKKEFSEKEIEKKAKKDKIIFIDMVPLKRKVDVAGAKMMKAFEFVEKQLKINDFDVKKSGWNWNTKAVMWFIINKKDLSKTTIREGPPLKAKEHVAKFKKIHKKTFEKKARVYAEINREYTYAESFIKDILKDEYIKDKVKSINLRK